MNNVSIHIEGQAPQSVQPITFRVRRSVNPPGDPWSVSETATQQSVLQTAVE